MRVRPAVLIFGVAGLLAAAAWPAAAPVAADPAIRAYSAVYEVHYNNKRVGTSEFSVRYDTSRGIYRFSSSTAARGVLKIIRPRPIVERSEFVSEAGTITPLEFWFEDGSRRGHDNFHILFDWDNEVAVAETEDGRQEFPLAHGTLDRGTMQIQVMLDMAQPGSLGSYTLTDDDGLTTYDYRADGDTLLETPYGSVSTQAFIQERAGSSRRLLLWAAPELHYLPVRIEQQRDGETRSVLVLESVEWLNSAQD